MDAAQIQAANAASPTLTQVNLEEVKQKIAVETPILNEEEKKSTLKDDQNQNIRLEEVYRRHCIGDQK